MGAAAALLFVLALTTGALATWLVNRARQEALSAEQQLRLRVLGADAADYVPKRSQKVNPLLTAAMQLVARSGLELTQTQVSWGLFGLIALLPVLWLLLGGLAGTLVGGVTLACMYGALARAAARRRLQIIEQMPLFLETVMRVLAAGNTLEESLAAAARESPDPIRPLFTSVGRQVRLGAPVETVLGEAADTYGLRDLKVVALAAAINRKYGGSLRQVLKSLIAAIRARGTAARELRALTAETRFSAFVLAVIPVVLSLYIFTRNKQYYAQMWADGSGKWLLLASVLLQVAGVALIWRMMTRTAGPGSDA